MASDTRAMSNSHGAYCRVLGPARLTIDGAEAPPEILWRKHLALLVYLARSPRRGRTREHLLGLLWSDRDERQARHSLSEALRVMRRTLGDEAVQVDVDQVRLAADAVTLDSDVLAERYARGDWAGAATLVEGEFLEGRHPRVERVRDGEPPSARCGGRRARRVDEGGGSASSGGDDSAPRTPPDARSRSIPPRK